MKIFQRYLIKSLIFKTLSISIILAVILWLAQSLKFSKMAPLQGAHIAEVIFLSLGVVPSLILNVVPVSFFMALSWVYYSFARSHERDIILGSGAREFSLAWPAVVVALGLTVLLYHASLYWGPVLVYETKSQAQRLSHSINPDLFTPGLFFEIGEKTLYIDQQGAGGKLQGLFVHHHLSSKDVFFTGQYGALESTPKGLMITIINGSRQEFFKEIHKPPLFLSFKKYTFYLTETKKVLPQQFLEPSFSRLCKSFQGTDYFPMAQKDLYYQYIFPLLPLCYSLRVSFLFIITPFLRYLPLALFFKLSISLLMVYGLLFFGIRLPLPLFFVAHLILFYPLVAWVRRARRESI